MFVGHGLLAFALVAIFARYVDVPPRRALALGTVAGAFAVLPDVDVVYGLVGLIGGVPGPEAVLGAFFDTGNVVHRGPTHSLVVGGIAAAAFGLLSHDSSGFRAVGFTTLCGLLALVATPGTVLDAGVTALFAVGGVGIVVLARRMGVGPRWVAATATVGLLSHPLGDLFTGEPPGMLYPIDVSLFESHVALHPDPTIHVLSAFAIELVIVWTAFVTYVRLTDRDLRTLVDRRAVVGVGYGTAAVVLPAPTLDAAEPFVFTVLAVGAIGVTPTPARWRPATTKAVATGLVAVSLAAAAYAVVYVLT